jgi:predicted porin
MKKSLLAVAVIGAFASAAQAQSSVTVYGTLDYSFGTTRYENIGGSTAASKQTTSSGINRGGTANGALTSNRIGFRGVEDLGGGNRALFNIEYGFSGSTDTNDGAAANALTTTAAREAHVTLETKQLGSLKAGYGTTLMHAMLVADRAQGGTNMPGDILYTSDSTSSADNRIHANMVRSSGLTYYVPQIIPGLVVAAAFGSDNTYSDGATNNSSRSGSRNIQGSARYTIGAFTIGGAMATAVTNVAGVTAVAVNTSVTAQVLAVAAAETKYSVNAVSTAYTYGPVKVDAVYAQRTSTNNLTGAQTGKVSGTQAGVKFTVTPVIYVTGAYGVGKVETTAANVADKDTSGYLLSAVYDLSKRTNLYLAYGTQAMKYKQTAGQPVEKITTTALGMRHTF